MNVKFDGMHNEHPTNELRGTVIPQGTLSCPSGNSPCAAPSVESPICVAVRKQLEHLRLRNGWPLAAPTEDEQYGRSPIVSVP